MQNNGEKEGGYFGRGKGLLLSFFTKGWVRIRENLTSISLKATLLIPSVFLHSHFLKNVMIATFAIWKRKSGSTLEGSSPTRRDTTQRDANTEMMWTDKIPLQTKTLQEPIRKRTKQTFQDTKKTRLCTQHFFQQARKASVQYFRQEL